MFFNSKIFEVMRVVEKIDPASKTAATYTSGWVDMQNWERIAALIQTGALGASATIDAKFQQATSSGGAGAKDVSGKAIAQMTQTPTDKSNLVACLEMRADEMDVANNFRYARLSLVVGTATSVVGAALFAGPPKLGPATDTTSAAVDQVV